MLRLLFAAIAVGFGFWVLVPGRPGSAVDPPLVCIDPGHGGSDPGAVHGALREADINLDVSFALAARLATDGVDATLTRADDSTKSARDRYELCNSARADLFIGVHTNSVSDPAIDGSLSIYFHSDDKLFGRDLQDAMLAGLGPTAPDPSSFTDFGLKKDALGVVLKTDMPGAVAEPVFMSNAEEAARLAQSVADCPDPLDNQCRRAQIVEALHHGISNYLAGQPAPTPTSDSGGPPPCPPGHERRGLC